MIKAIPMEDWLRGCIYHDGRHGYVTLPIDKVHQIANYIQRTRRSGMDGLIDLEVVEADRKTENCSEKPNNCKDEPMKTTDYCDICKRDMCEVCTADATNPYCVPSHYEINYEPKDEPQTDGYMTEEQAEDYRKMLDKAEHKVYGNIEDEPQTEDTCKGCVNETDCPWK